MRVGGDVVNRFLLYRHTREVGCQRFGLRSIFASRRVKTHQVGEDGTIIVIFDDTLF